MTACEPQRSAKMRIQIRFRPTQCVITFLFAFCTGSLAANWEATLTRDPPGNFPELRPLHASYRFGWTHAERSEEHTSELQSQSNLVCRLLLEKKKNMTIS